MHADAAAATAAIPPRRSTLLHPDSAGEVSRSRSGSRRASPTRSRNGSGSGHVGLFGASASLLPFHLQAGSATNSPMAAGSLSAPLSPLKPFDPATACANQLDLRALEAHMRITIAALDKARARFIRTNTCRSTNQPQMHMLFYSAKSCSPL